MRTLCRKDKRELTILADDFELLRFDEVQEIIKNCSSYAEARNQIMRVYDRVYIHELNRSITSIQHTANHK